MCSLVHTYRRKHAHASTSCHKQLRHALCYEMNIKASKLTVAENQLNFQQKPYTLFTSTVLHYPRSQALLGGMGL